MVEGLLADRFRWMLALPALLTREQEPENFVAALARRQLQAQWAVLVAHCGASVRAAYFQMCSLQQT